MTDTCEVCEVEAAATYSMSGYYTSICADCLTIHSGPQSLIRLKLSKPGTKTLRNSLRDEKRELMELDPAVFQSGAVTLHSGLVSDWKIECDNLTDSEIELFAKLIRSNFSFNLVYSVPTGGDRLARALQRYCRQDMDDVLIVDDVYTTGTSMEERKLQVLAELRSNSRPRRAFNIHGVVLFARSEIQHGWIRSVFTYGLD